MATLASRINDLVVAIGADIKSLAASIAGKEDTLPTGSTSQYFRGDKSLATLNAGAVGLSNVNNTADSAKPVSTAQASAIALKQNVINVGTTAPGSPQVNQLWLDTN